MVMSSQEVEGVPSEALDEKQLEVVRLAVHERRNVFFTGPAGCGKSTVLKKIRNELRDQRLRVGCLAPTGCAALAIKGQTIHSFAGLGAELNKSLDTYAEIGKGRAALRELDVIIIDEISMVSKEVFERLDIILKAARGNDTPFGGVQTIVLGDFRQLPPVAPFKYCLTCGREREEIRRDVEYRCPEHGRVFLVDQWAFRSLIWRDLKFTNVLLRHVHRQTNREFLELLNQLWLGRALKWTEAKRLEDHVHGVKNAVTLYGMRKHVKEHNDREFRKLPGPAVCYEGLDNFNRQHDLHPELFGLGKRVYRSNELAALREHKYNYDLQLKVGMPVILLTNLDVQRGLVNGSQGMVVDFIDADNSQTESSQVKYSPSFQGMYANIRRDNVREFMTGSRGKVPVVKFSNHAEPMPIFPDCSVSEHGFKLPHSLLMRTQIPLLPSWAITIHKAQGMTIDRVRVDLANFWTPELAYVALSRARHWEFLEVFNARGVQISGSKNPEVTAFLLACFPEDLGDDFSDS